MQGSEYIATIMPSSISPTSERGGSEGRPLHKPFPLHPLLCHSEATGRGDVIDMLPSDGFRLSLQHQPQRHGVRMPLWFVWIGLNNGSIRQRAYYSVVQEFVWREDLCLQIPADRSPWRRRTSSLFFCFRNVFLLRCLPLLEDTLDQILTRKWLNGNKQAVRKHIVFLISLRNLRNLF